MKKYHANSNELFPTRFTDPKFFRNFENCIKFGRICMVENVGLMFDPLIENILQKNLIKKGSTYFVKIGD